MANIDLLEHHGSVAVVTGQQVGLFTGPLYTVYKALSTIRLAQRLRVEGIQAVPVFWMDTDDHDLAEICHATLTGSDAGVRNVDFLPILYETVPERAQPIGSLLLPSSIDAAVSLYVEAIPKGRHRDEAVSDLREAYRPGVGFATAFARLMARLFRGRGLVLFDPHDAESKRLLSPVFRQAVEHSVSIRDQVENRSHELTEHGLHAQVAVLENSTVLFLEHEGERRALTTDGSGFRPKGSDTIFSAEDLARLAEEDPQRFSPNVLLRPIAQDFLFPTAAYVAGPAETAYFAQVHVLYELFGRTMPVIWPRDSFTLLEPEVSAVLDSYTLELEDCLAGKHHITERMIQKGKHAGGLRRLRELEAKLDHELDAVQPAVAAADASLGPALDTAKRKVQHQLKTLEAKLVHFESRRDGQFTHLADFLLSRCVPDRLLQERQFGVLPFTARFGPSLLQVLHELCASGAFTHQVVRLHGDPD